MARAWLAWLAWLARREELPDLKAVFVWGEKLPLTVAQRWRSSERRVGAWGWEVSAACAFVGSCTCPCLLGWGEGERQQKGAGAHFAEVGLSWDKPISHAKSTWI